MNFLTALLALLPACRAKNRLITRLVRGWDVHDTVHFAPTVVWGVRNAAVSGGAIIGFGNVFRNLQSLSIGEQAQFGQWNWISSAQQLWTDDPGTGALRLGFGAAVTNRHYLDATGGITVGAMTTIAGVRSTFITHQIDVERSCQVAEPITIGEYCLIGSNACVIPGAQVADRTLSGMGAILTRRAAPPGSVVRSDASSPRGTATGKYFHRITPYVRAEGATVIPEPPQDSDVGSPREQC